MFSILKEHQHNWKQIAMLARTELKKDYKGSFLGSAWALVKPLFTLFIYWFAFDVGLRASGDINGFPRFIFMLPGFIPWFFISDSILFGSQSIRKNRQFVVKMHFPVSNIMTFTLLAKFYVHLVLSALLMIFLTLSGYYPTIYALQYLYYCPLMFLFFLALSRSTAPMSAFSRDFENLIKSIMTGLFWLSGVVWDSYALKDIPWLYNLMLLSPINYFVNGYRKAFLYQEWFWEYPQETLIFFVEFIAIILLGIFNYNRLRKKLPDVL